MNHLLMLNKKANSKVAFCYFPFLNDMYYIDKKSLSLFNQSNQSKKLNMVDG